MPHVASALIDKGMGTVAELRERLKEGAAPLTPAERAMIAVVVSSANNCRRGVQVHTEALASLTDDEHLVTNLGRDYRLARLNERGRAILDFAVLVTKDVHLVSRVSIQELKAVGLTEHEVLDVVQLTSFINYENRVTDALGLEPSG